MKLIKPYIEVYFDLPPEEMMKKVEMCGRVCYKSEARITEGSAEKFIANLIKRGHEAVLEHASITVKFVTDRGISHEIVRHRIASYCQESTRYCNYMKDDFGKEITFIIPNYINENSATWNTWTKSMKACEDAYFDLLNIGLTAQEARAVLPNSLKTELFMTANLREWRSFLKLRTSPAAHPQMREIAGMLLQELKAQLPVVFGDID